MNEMSTEESGLYLTQGSGWSTEVIRYLVVLRSRMIHRGDQVFSRPKVQNGLQK